VQISSSCCACYRNNFRRLEFQAEASEGSQLRPYDWHTPGQFS
jgi:hypothetical protein